MKKSAAWWKKHGAAMFKRLMKRGKMWMWRHRHYLKRFYMANKAAVHRFLKRHPKIRAAMQRMMKLLKAFHRRHRKGRVHIKVKAKAMKPKSAAWWKKHGVNAFNKFLKRGKMWMWRHRHHIKRFYMANEAAIHRFL